SPCPGAVFLRGFRTPEGNLELQRFHALFAPFEYLSVVVAQELRAGVRASADRKSLEKHVLNPFLRRGRVLTPTESAWNDSGDILSELARLEGLDLYRLPKSFGNDILLALSCRDAGMVLVTENTRDFQRIARIAPFEFIGPWPIPGA
ncbi:MAG TPA: type II toxin-antitoxin system VapC family toxin, partial [Fibrobacteria bacterium]|nr:type II toxin-antitoxin system VapC family toxin [Fibrobacteria bacterium]